MIIRHKTRVLIIDDSLLFRETVKRGLQLDPAIEVVGTACDPFEARDKIIDLEPDVLTLDVEMPKMSGIQFLKRLMPQYPIPAVVVSSVSSSVFDAMSAGAVDFVSKPSPNDKDGLASFFNELILKIKIASMVNVEHHKRIGCNSLRERVLKRSQKDYIISIGSSTGGPEALSSIITGFPPDIPPTVIVQHMPPVFTDLYAQRLDRICQVKVAEAKDGDVLTQGLVLIAPGDMHMKVVKKASGYVVRCFEGEKVNGHCPSVDVLFDSVAEAAGNKAIGIILTGMGYDGAKGLLNMKNKGAYTIGQDEDTCVVYGMPRVAYNIGAVIDLLPIDQITDRIINRLNTLK